MLVCSTVAGQIISRTGRWKAFLVAGALTMAAGLGLLSTLDSGTGFGLLSVYMAVLGVGMLTQNLVLVVQNDVPAHQPGAATWMLSFFRSLGGTIGTSVLGAVLANRVADGMTKGLAALPGGGPGAVPDMSALPAPVKAVVENAYGTATGDLFLTSLPFAVLALIAFLFIREKPLKTTTSVERRAEEEAQGQAPVSVPAAD